MRDLKLPETFARNIEVSFGEAGRRFLVDLPRLLESAASRWDLELGECFDLSYNYVCRAKLGDGSKAVLKLGVPCRELASEIEALRLYDGEGVCRLLEADAEGGVLLLEALEPGLALANVEDDDEATAIAAELMTRLARPAARSPAFIGLGDWFGELANFRSRYGAMSGRIPKQLVDTVEGQSRELLAEERSRCLIHGDFHHFNVVSSNRGWVAIDPKGVIGPPEYEAAPFLINPWGVMPGEVEAERRSRRRLAILAERTGLDRSRLVAWALCHSLLSAYWDLDEEGRGGDYALAWAAVFSKMRRAA